jgi:hypothetical protein
VLACGLCVQLNALCAATTKNAILQKDNLVRKQAISHQNRQFNSSIIETSVNFFNKKLILTATISTIINKNIYIISQSTYFLQI